MILKKQNLKIATILPYKENYTSDKASAASLWVAEFYKKSKFKKNIHIYGHTKSKKYLTKNYININLKSLKSKFKYHFKSDQSWIELIIKAANIYGSFGEYWTYASWVNHINKNDLNYYPYEEYGLSTERFYDNGNGLFSQNYKKHINFNDQEDFYPSYSSILNFIDKNYQSHPSSLSFETNIRHTKKRSESIHLEEKRSIWREKKAYDIE